ncbi:hypothetical protein AVEN_238536-1 [Araneus ventricosus]|uniref:Uncharacterized protein n=1 Tax=Araneus ventricosus TaxID=182803 RepID=A0A4Y2WGK5_ARAVE|nr:hypothetical protein AVEN_238536-1 [Araneus ventricosus]
MNYIAGPQNHPLVVRGRQGRGKSALLSVASVLCGAVFPTMPILFRSAGVSAESFTQEQILRSICEQLAALYGEHPSIASRHCLLLPGISWQLRNELLHQQTEIRNHLQTFRDRPDHLSSLMNYIAGPQNHPLVVRGRQGRGKSALLSVASVLCGAVFPTMPILFRSAGVSAESFTQEQILRSICEQLAALYGEHPSIASRVSASFHISKLAIPVRPCYISF